MSSVPTLVTQEMFHYLTAHANPEDPFLTELKQAATDRGIPDIWISSEQAIFMQVLLRLARAERVLEIGALAGYSALVMATTLPDDGLLTTIEINSEYAAFAREWFDKSPQKDRIELREGDAAGVLPELDDESFDAVFIDADKANQGLYLTESLRLLRASGLVMVDNAFAFGKLIESEGEEEATDDIWSIRKFNDLMAREKRVTSIIIPVGDGMWVGVKA